MFDTQTRDYGIDNIRAFAIILVVIGHSIILYSSSWSLYETEVPAPYFDFLKKIINVIQMPLFFALAGYLFYTKVKKIKLKNIIIAKFKRLLIPFLAFSFLWLLPIRLLVNYPGYQNLSVKTIVVDKILFGFDNGHLWYLPTLFLCFVFYAVIITLEQRVGGERHKNYYLNFAIGLIMYVVQIFLALTPYIGYVCQYFWLFSLGLLIHEMKLMHCDLKRKKWLKVIVGTLCVVATVTYLCKPNLIFINIDSFLWVLLFFVMKFSQENKFLKIVSDNSFGIYLFHSPLVYITYTYCDNFSPWIVFSMNFFIFGGMSLLFSYMLRKTRIKILLGE